MTGSPLTPSGTWSVEVLSVGNSLIRGPQAFWNDAWDEMIPLAFNVVVARTGGKVVLVNTSPPETTRVVEELFPRMRYLHDAPRGDLIREPHEHIEAALATLGLTPDDVDVVVLTPFELYTTGTLALFRRATICLSRRGWVHFHTTHEHPHDKRWRKFPKDTLLDLVTDSWDRVRLLDDEDEVLPGMRTWWAGSHHRESIVVEIDSPAGKVAVTDAFFYYANVEDGRLLGLNESMAEALSVNERVLRTADHIVPIHEPLVFERYPGGVVAKHPEV
ncbi:MAG: hypothetical protein M3Y20_08330 [Actinomycetota bacterium]|nr:hypothetical protein [Actinomycetota bacterium]